MTDEKRLIDLEIKIAHQDQVIEELHQVIYNQQKQIDLIENKVTVLIKKLQEQMENGTPEIGPGDQKPPHY